MSGAGNEMPTGRPCAISLRTLRCCASLAAMLAAEEYAIERGAQKLGLSVFGFNEVAQNLYRSFGYSVLAMNMVKPLA